MKTKRVDQMRMSSVMLAGLILCPVGSAIAQTLSKPPAIIHESQQIPPDYLNPPGHRATITDAQFSHDGTKVATSSADNTSIIWTIQGKQLMVLPGHSARFSPDGNKILTVCEDKLSCLWTLNGKKLAEYLGSESAEFSPDGTKILTVYSDQVAYVYSLDGKLESTFTGNSAHFSPDGKKVVTASGRDTARIWSLDGKQLTEIKGPKDSTVWVRFSPDGKKVVTTSHRGTVRIWSLEGKLLTVLKSDDRYECSQPAQFNSDGTMVMVSSKTKTRVWSMDGKELSPLGGYGWRDFGTAQFGPDEKTILTTSYYQATIMSWDGKPLITLGARGSYFDGPCMGDPAYYPVDVIARVSPDRAKIVTSHFDWAWIWSAKGELLSVLNGQIGRDIYSAQFSSDGDKVVTSVHSGPPKIWTLDGRELTSLTSDVGLCGARVERFGKGETKIVSIHGDRYDQIRSAQILSLDGKEQSLSIPWGDESIWVLSLHSCPNGPIALEIGMDLGSAIYDHKVRIQPLDGKNLQMLVGHQDNVVDAKFNEDCTKVVTASADSTARIWSVEGNELAVLRGHTSGLLSAQFSPDGTKVITTSRDNTSRIWSLEGKQLANLSGHGGAVLAAQFSQDGTKVVTASGDNTARVWSLNGKQLAELSGHTATVYSANFSPDGTKIVTASADGGARIWDLKGVMSPPNTPR